MTSVAACDPELPPLEMMSGTNSASTTAFAISSSNAPIAVAVSISPRKSAVSHPARFLNHPPEGDADIRLVQGFRSADPLDLPGRGRLGHVQDVVDRDDADQHAGGVGDRQCRAIVLTEHGDGGLLIVRRLQRDEAPIHEVRDSALQRRQQELANADVVDQQTLVVDHVDDVQRFAVLRRARARSPAPRGRSTARGRRRSGASSAGRPTSRGSRAASPRRRVPRA